MGRRAPKCVGEARAVLQLLVGRVQVENFNLYTLQLWVFFQVLLLNILLQNLKKKQPDTMCHPPAGCSRGLADEVKHVY